LDARIAKAISLGAGGITVVVSSATDPFQPIDRNCHDSRYVLDRLLSNGFTVLVMTRVPQTLLEPAYDRVVVHPRLFIDVSIPSLNENRTESIFYSPHAPSLRETLDAMTKLAQMNKHIRVKIEPVVPTTAYCWSD
jgi:DNA repair photolyase